MQKDSRLKFLILMLDKEIYKLFALVFFTLAYVSLVLLQPIIFGFLIDNVINRETINNSLFEEIEALLDAEIEEMWATAVQMHNEEEKLVENKETPSED